MNYKFLFVVVILVILVACKYPKDEKEPDVNPNKCSLYACPIHPDKTNATLENCPVCDTPMILISNSVKRDSLKHTFK